MYPRFNSLWLLDFIVVLINKYRHGLGNHFNSNNSSLTSCYKIRNTFWLLLFFSFIYFYLFLIFFTLSNIQVVSSISLSQCIIHSFLYLALSATNPYCKFFSVIHTQNMASGKDIFFQYSNNMVKVEMFYTILNIRTCCIIYNIYCKIVNQVR